MSLKRCQTVSEDTALTLITIPILFIIRRDSRPQQSCVVSVQTYFSLTRCIFISCPPWRKMTFSQILRLMVACLFSGTSLFATATEADVENRFQSLSLINLIATPERYDGKLVLVTGYVTVGRENMSICLTKVRNSSKDCLWLNVDSGPYETEEDRKRIDKKYKVLYKFNGKVATIEAIFDQNDMGHFGMWSGALKDFVRIYDFKNKYYMFDDKAVPK
ncbi:hypothetical protein ACO0LN_23025 [Undibacterium sp. TC9W]